MTILAAIDGKILLTGCRERVCGGQEDRLPPAGQASPRSLDVRAILNIGLQHRSFTSLSPNGNSSEKASDADFDCAWGEKMRIGTEEVGPSQGCRLGRGLRRVSLWADESGVSRLGLQYAVYRGLSGPGDSSAGSPLGTTSAVARCTKSVNAGRLISDFMADASQTNFQRALVPFPG
jgi:hypothetical protein